MKKPYKTKQWALVDEDTGEIIEKFFWWQSAKSLKKQYELDNCCKLKIKFIEKCGEIEFRMVEGSDEFVQLEALLASFILK